MAFDQNQKFLRADHVVVCEIKDGGALLDLETSKYFQLNSTANFIWDQLEDGAMSAAGIAARLVDTYEVDQPTAMADVTEMLRQFSQAGLIAAQA